MKLLLTVGAGSFLGGVLRYIISQFIQNKAASSFPWGTLCVNIAGCFLIGLVFGIGIKQNFATEWRLFLVTGILGGFTTFSAFSNESVNLIQIQAYLQAATYIFLSVFVGLAATFGGYLVTMKY